MHAGMVSCARSQALVSFAASRLAVSMATSIAMTASTSLATTPQQRVLQASRHRATARHRSTAPVLRGLFGWGILTCGEANFSVCLFFLRTYSSGSGCLFTLCCSPRSPIIISQQHLPLVDPAPDRHWAVEAAYVNHLWHGSQY